MAKGNKRHTGKKTPNPSPPASSAKGSNIEGQPNAQPKENDCRYVKQEPPDIYVYPPPPGKEKWSYANKIAAGVGIITLALTIFTYLLFVKAGVQADQAVRAANSAESVYGETKKEFDIENTPYLFMTSVKTDTFRMNKPTTASVYITNFGKKPALLVYAQSTFAYQNTSFGYEPGSSHYFNIFMAPGAIHEIPINTVKVPQEFALGVLIGKVPIFAHGEVFYSDIISHKEYEYDFAFQILTDGTIGPCKRHNGIREIEADSSGIKIGEKPSPNNK
jgi:hypothetical protein